MSTQWQSEHALTDILANYLTTHPTDCQILFYSKGKKKVTLINDTPSNRDKGDVYGTITHLIFTNHIKYCSAFHQNQKKFSDLVSNRIIRNKYKKHKNKFTATGAGIMLLNGPSAQNLLHEFIFPPKVICADLPWYQDLNAIWHSNPAMAVKTHSSKLGIDHATAHTQPQLSIHHPTHTPPSKNVYPLFHLPGLNITDDFGHANDSPSPFSAPIDNNNNNDMMDTDAGTHTSPSQVAGSHSLVLDKEAENFRLKIQFHQMTQSNRPDEGV
ncbi:hypothetical protein EDD22DRAFT_849954 [Suillus occidentalis]|nr:hypothetical protein EDD22DRAFT_849954 [Suillus occidentalis]